jgi:hypothetical protein
MNAHALRCAAIALAATLLAAGCGGAGSSSTVSPSTNSSTASPASNGNSLASVYRAAQWSSAASVSFSGSCSMTLTTSGVPPYHSDYYLAPVSTQNSTSVAVTPVSHTEMALIAYSSSNIAGATTTFNVCPAKAATTTATNMGPIGYTIAGEALFNPYEADGASTPALSDNVSYSFTTGGGVAETAWFIDPCNSHAAAGAGGSTWHYHGVPSCLTAQIDGSSGPSHLIGIALDGFPIYGGRDINGNTIAVSQLDACNGITSPTPEFPNGVYHYVLPIGVTGKQSSLNCYSGTVSQSQLASASRYICGLDALNRRLQAAARVRRLRIGLGREIAERQLTDPLAGEREDRVTDGRRDRRGANLTDAGGLLRTRHDVHLDARRVGHAQHRVVVEVVLLHPAMSDRDLSGQRG